jgi:CheY-like chemotaxis protein
MVAGDFAQRMPISESHDLVDALSHGVNVLGGEIGLLTARFAQARDEARRASDEKDQHLRTLSHELRTPLAAILGLLDLAERAEASPERRQALLGRARANVLAMVALADDLVDTPRTEALRLKLAPAPGSPVEIAREVAPPASPVRARDDAGLEGCRVLLCEDDPDVGESLSQLLSLAGARVAWEMDGESACTRAAAEPFDLLVLDLRLPRLDGIAAIQRLRALGIKTPAAALTADVLPHTRAQCLAAGFDAHLSKGMPLDVLRRALGQLRQGADSSPR